MGTKRTFTASNSDTVMTKQSGNHWSQGLLTSMNDNSLKVYEDDLVIAIKDKYPKAKYHYLVCPKQNIPSLKAVSVVQLDLLKHMDKVGKDISSKNGNNFLQGYHSVPSMTRLHLHVISDDFDSVCLKTKKHWNSYTTSFFLSSGEVIKQLETDGKISFISMIESKKLINQPLKCHKCCYSPKNMPDLKNHLQQAHTNSEEEKN